MSTDKRFDQSVTSWLEETAPARLPERVLEATFERTRRSRQQVGWRALSGRLNMSRSASALGGAAAVLVVAGLAVGFALNQPDKAEGPGRPSGIFADVGGWIAFGDAHGIWAVDPTRPGGPDSLVQLSSKGGTPKAWSPDGSKLLVLRDVESQRVLFVLKADGTETRLTNVTFRSGGDFTADGSRVVYAGPSRDGPGIYVIDAEGGTPELLHSGYAPTLSPDGTQIAYFDGRGDSGHSLRVMNSDGTGEHAVVENSMTLGAGHVVDASVDWSPDGEHLLFVFSPFMGVSVVGIDGSGLKELSSDKYVEGVDPHWSPDGSVISYNHLFGTKLAIAPWDGTAIQEFAYGRSGPWNPGLGALESEDPSPEPQTPRS